MTALPVQTSALGAQATKHAAEGRTFQPITTPAEVPVSRPLSPFAVLAEVDLRGKPIEGAQCRFDPELHTGPDGAESPEERAARELVAVEVCESCPLRAECLDLATRIRPEGAVWAGFTPVQLAALFAMYELTEVA
ncbi:WhiB family transcriptional regulator [Actinomadura chibensis]|uniref:4Fe-4S Wbl-type domain-containing protein n=1 Tax=Actinomadura chibensis TaxID=392828 RepID=A0A5D0NU43_9ACTN|nr:WhiB family transcriptional regulator [Actinomadura chibensis]TYB47875.1 hypothetical protein FXF69_01065 [Actinomadura chibensis]